VPVATNSAIPRTPDIFAVLGGSSDPFSADDLVARYDDRAGFLARFEAAARAAVDAGVLLPRDEELLVAEAAESWNRAVSPSG
jgi:hypothetical protein